MVEAYRVGVALALQGNMLGAVEAIAREMRALDKLVRQTQDAFTALGRSFSESARSAISVAEQLGRVLRENANDAARIADAMRMGARGAAGGGDGAGGGAPGTARYMRQEAAWYDSDYNMRRATQRALADYENARIDANYRDAYGLAGRENADRNQQYDDAYSLAGRENADRDQRYRDAYALAQWENRDRDAAAAHRHVREGDLLALGIGGAYAGHETMGMIDQSFMAYSAVGAEQAKLAMAGFSKQQQQSAALAARQVAETMPVPQVAGLEMIRDAYAVLQNAGEATKVLPDLARMSVVLGAVGKGDQVSELFSAQTAGELRGAFSKPGSKEIDFARFADFLGKMSNVVVETGGRISPADFVKFLKQAGTAGALMTDRALFEELPAVMLAMGSFRAGTATSSFYQSEFGRLYAPYGHEQERIGLIAPGGYVKTHGSGGGSIRQGALRGEQLAKTDLDLWTLDTLLPTMRAAGYKDTPSQLVELYRLFPRNTITREIEELIRNQALIEKHITGFENVQANAAKNGGLYAEAVRNNPELQLQQFHTAENNFLVAVGKNLAGPATAALKEGTAALDALGDWATAHPTMGKIIEGTAVGLGVLATAVGSLSLSLLPLLAAGRVGRAGLRLLGIGGAGAAAGEAAAGAGGAVAAPALGIVGVGGGAAYFLYEYGKHFRAEHPGWVNAVMEWEHDHPRGIFGWGPAVNHSDGTALGKRGSGAPGDGALTADEIGKAMRANLDGMKVTLDGQTVGQLVAKHQAKAANRPPTTPSQPDVRLTPLYPTSGYP